MASQMDSVKALTDRRVAGARVPAASDVHLVMDDYGTHKTPTVRARFERHPRFHVHSIPTSSSADEILDSLARFLNAFQTAFQTRNTSNVPTRSDEDHHLT